MITASPGEVTDKEELHGRYFLCRSCEQWESAITTKRKLEGVAKHNLRKYKSDEYSAENIMLLYGTENLVKDVKKYIMMNLTGF